MLKVLLTLAKNLTVVLSLTDKKNDYTYPKFWEILTFRSQMNCSMGELK